MSDTNSPGADKFQRQIAALRAAEEKVRDLEMELYMTAPEDLTPGLMKAVAEAREELAAARAAADAPKDEKPSSG